MKKLTFLLGAAAVLVLSCSMWFGAAGSPRRVHAQSGCSVQTVNGTYAYANTGYLITSDLNFFASAGTITTDGNGNASGVDTTSLNGEITRNRRYSANYTVGSDCRGSISFSIGGQAAGFMDFVVSNGGKQIQFIQTDRGTIISGTATQQ